MLPIIIAAAAVGGVAAALCATAIIVAVRRRKRPREEDSTTSARTLSYQLTGGNVGLGAGVQDPNQPAVLANQHDGPTGVLPRRFGVGRATNAAERASLDVSPYGSPPPVAAGDGPGRASGTLLAHDRPDETRLHQAFTRAFGGHQDAAQVQGPAHGRNMFAWDAPGGALAPPSANGVPGNSDFDASGAGAGARWPRLGLQNDYGAHVRSAPNAGSINPTDGISRAASREGGRTLMGAFSFLSRFGVERSSSPSAQHSGLGQGYARPSQDGSPQQGLRVAQGLAWAGLGGGSGGGLQNTRSPHSSSGKPQSPTPRVSFYNHAFAPGEMEGRRQGGAVPSIADVGDRPQLKRRITASMSAIPGDDLERGRAANGALSSSNRALRQVHGSEDGSGLAASRRGAGSLASRFASQRDLGPALARVAVKRAGPGPVTPVQELDPSVAARLDSVLYLSSGQGAAAVGAGGLGQQRREGTGAWREAPATAGQPAESLLEEQGGAAAATPLRSMSPLLVAAQSVHGQSPRQLLGQVRGTSGGPLPSWQSPGAAAAVAASPNRLPLRSPLRPATSTAVRAADSMEGVPGVPLARSTSRQALRRAVTYATASGGMEAVRGGQEQQGPRVSGPVSATTSGAPAGAAAGGSQSTLLSVRRRTATVLGGRRATYNGTGSMAQPRQATWVDDQGLQLSGGGRGGGPARVAVMEEEEQSGAGARAAASMAWGP